MHLQNFREAEKRKNQHDNKNIPCQLFLLGLSFNVDLWFVRAYKILIAYIFNSRLMSGTEGKSMCKNTCAPTNHTVEAKEKLYQFILITIFLLY